MCVFVENFVTIRQTVAEIWLFFTFLNGGRPPSWICCVRVWTTLEGYLVVFITVQKFGWKLGNDVV